MKFILSRKKREELAEARRASIAHGKTQREYVPLYLLLTVVPGGQAGAISKIVRGAGASSTYACHGQGTAPSDLYDVFSLTRNPREVLLTPIRSDMYPPIRKALLERFQVSSGSKGVAALLPISSVIGKNAYRLLADDRVGIDQKGAIALMEATPMQKDFELIIAIVNDSYTDLVMDAAKAAGARGGTVLNAKGTGNKDIESFFGIVITPEKQIVLILVPKEIKNAVLEAIYKNAGLHSKGQGIVFSLPTTDVLGLAEEAQAEEEGKKEEEAPAAPKAAE